MRGFGGREVGRGWHSDDRAVWTWPHVQQRACVTQSEHQVHSSDFSLCRLTGFLYVFAALCRSASDIFVKGDATSKILVIII